MNKKKLFLWSLYDFANSFVFINFLLYFSQRLVLDGGLSDLWYNMTFTIATIVLLFSAPRLASYTDKWWHRKLFLILATIGTAVCYWLSVIFAYLWFAMTTIVIFFILGQYFYQLSFVFYNPLIQDIADEKHYSRAFGIGQFANSLWQVIWLLVTLPLIAVSRLAPLIPSIIMFVVLSLPMLIWFKESKKKDISTMPITSWWAMSLSKSKVFLFFTTSVAAPMIIAFFFFNDASLTVTNNFGIFLQKVFGIADNIKSILLILIVVMSAIWWIVAWWIGDRFGKLKTLKGIFIWWILCLTILAITSNTILFYVTTISTWLLVGGARAISRAYLISVLKKDELGYGFSFYALSERFATFLWPLVRWRIVWFYGQSVLWYRLAMGFMILFMVIWLIILIPNRRKKFVENIK